MNKHISSQSNPLVKQILQLKLKSKLRKTSGLFVVEGRREVQLAIDGGYKIETLLFSDKLSLESLPIGPNEYISVSEAVYDKLAHRGTTEGMIALVQMPKHELSHLKMASSTPLILIAEAPEKPGNIGALFRTADAAKLDAVLIANPKTDLYNPNIIRSSVGGIFTVPVATGSTEEIINWLKAKHISIYAAALEQAESYQQIDFTAPTAIVVGTEDQGLSQLWLESAQKVIKIPMSGQIDSLNVSVSAAILIFEAKRQRGF
jgi:TrmH family RNA methyltransferase